jgi:hypothetical protein
MKNPKDQIPNSREEKHGGKFAIGDNKTYKVSKTL